MTRSLNFLPLGSRLQWDHGSETGRCLGFWALAEHVWLCMQICLCLGFYSRGKRKHQALAENSEVCWWKPGCPSEWKVVLWGSEQNCKAPLSAIWWDLFSLSLLPLAFFIKDKLLTYRKHTSGMDLWFSISNTIQTSRGKRGLVIIVGFWVWSWIYFWLASKADEILIFLEHFPPKKSLLVCVVSF